MIKTIKIFLILIIFLSIGIMSSCSSRELVNTDIAQNAYNVGKYMTAITYSNEALKKDPDNYTATLIRGKANLKLGNYKESIGDFNKLLDNRKNFELYYLRGRTFLEMDNLENAESDYETAISLNPKSVEALFDLAYIRTLIGDYDLAISAYQQVIKIDSLNFRAYVNLGNLKGRMGEGEMAIEYFSKAISINPNDGIAYFNRATEKLILNDKTGAIYDLLSSISLDTSNINTHSLIAETYLQLKDYDNAIKHLDEIIDLDNQNARAYFLKGSAELALNKNDLACTDLRTAGELGYFDAYELIKKNCNKKEKKKSKR